MIINVCWSDPQSHPGGHRRRCRLAVLCPEGYSSYTQRRMAALAPGGGKTSKPTSAERYAKKREYWTSVRSSVYFTAFLTPLRRRHICGSETVLRFRIQQSMSNRGTQKMPDKWALVELGLTAEEFLTRRDYSLRVSEEVRPRLAKPLAPPALQALVPAVSASRCFWPAAAAAWLFYGSLLLGCSRLRSLPS